ncbi:MAG: sulfatase [Acidobacteria bacterium]|nr:sulfatase [Acidobacteriota bacterium]
MRGYGPDARGAGPAGVSGHRSALWVLSVCGLIVAVVGCSLGPAAPDLERYRDCDILVVLVDALRADQLGCFGAGRNTSPNIDAVASGGVKFDRAISQSTFTACSIASLFTGLYPHHHGLYWGSLGNGQTRSAHMLSPDYETLAELLAANGYATMSCFQNRTLRAELGFGQGFQVYKEIRGGKSMGSRRIIDTYLRWLAERTSTEPTFAYLHLLDLHEPYDPRPPYETTFLPADAAAPAADLSTQNGWFAWSHELERGERQIPAAELRWVVARYDGIVRSVDKEIGRMVHRLRDLGRYENTLLVITADHGDGFFEHGFLGHCRTPYEEVVHVPLILKLPGGDFAGLTVPHQVELVDLLPTLAEMATGGNVELPDGLDGCSLAPLLVSGSQNPLPGQCREALSEVLLKGEHLVVAVRDGNLTYFVGDGIEPALYDRTTDPSETVNLVGRGLPGESRLRQRALEVITDRQVTRVRRHPVDSEALEQIRALGYLN